MSPVQGQILMNENLRIRVDYHPRLFCQKETGGQKPPPPLPGAASRPLPKGENGGNPDRAGFFTPKSRAHTRHA